MRAILRKQFGGSDVLEIREMPEPEPKIGHAVANENSTFMNAKMPEPYGTLEFNSERFISLRPVFVISIHMTSLTKNKEPPITN